MKRRALLHSELAAPAASSTRWLDRALLALLLLSCGVALSKNLADPDLWGHVAYGRELLREGLPRTATYTYTADGHRWINHENLSEILLALGVDTIGPTGLLWIKCGLGLLVMTWIVRRALQSGASALTVCLTASLVAANLMHFWSMRPQLLTYVFFALLIRLLEAGLPGPHPGCALLERQPPAASGALAARFGVLWTTPLLLAVWANTHGAFVAAWLLLVLYLGCRAVQWWMRSGRAALGPAAHLAAIALVCGAATLLNPYGADLHRWLLGSLSAPRPEIVEWRRPELWSVVWLPFWAAVAAASAALALSRRPRDLAQLALLAVTLWQAVEHRRHIPFFVILLGFWLPPHLESMLARFGIGRQPGGRSSQPSAIRWTLAAGGAAAVLIGFCLVTQLRQFPVRRDSYPVSALEFIHRQRLHGKMVVRFKWAQYVIAACGADRPDQPGVQVAFDGRFRTCYPQQVVDMYFDFAVGEGDAGQRFRSPRSPPMDGGRILEYRQPNLVLIDRQQEHAVAQLRARTDQWTLLYQDQLAQLWGRASEYDDSSSPSYLPPALRQVSDQPQLGLAAWPALPHDESALSRSVVLRP